MESSALVFDPYFAPVFYQKGFNFDCGYVTISGKEILNTTVDKTLQETRAWMAGTLTMLEVQRDTIKYEDMNISEMTRYIRHTAGQNDVYSAGLYVALTDGSLYHASFVPGMEFSALVKSWYVNGLESRRHCGIRKTAGSHG